ncbi:MAG: hypothetical protein RL154_1297, partial [Pseudomonadota bacterium]
KRAALNEVLEELDKKSSYITFKKWIIRDNQIFFKEFSTYL